MNRDALLAILAVAATLAAAAVVADVVVAGTGSEAASSATAGVGSAAASTGTAGASIGGELDGSNPVEPSLSTPNSLNRSESLPAALSLPESANGSRSFVVRVERASGSVVTRENVTLAPGESTTVDFGPCLEAGNYVVRVTTPEGDVLVASASEVRAPASPVTFANRTGGGVDETVTREDVLHVEARLHGCVERATFELADGQDVVWRATLVDADGDGEVSFTWDLDTATDEHLAVGDGDALENATVDAETISYGKYGYNVRQGGDHVASWQVTVSFADPRVDVISAESGLNATEAIAAARGDAAGGDDADDGGSVHGPRPDSVVEGNWVVLRIDTDDTLDSLPADARLAAPARHENATVRVSAVPRPSTDGGESDVDLANATRRFDAENDTVWYAVRADEEIDRTIFEYVAFGQSWNATDRVRVNVVPRAHLQLPEPKLLPPRENASIEGFSGLPDGTTLAVTVRADEAVLARDDVTVSDRSIRPTLDLSDVPNGTNATLVVEHDGDRAFEEDVTVASRAVLEFRGMHVAGALRADEPATVRVFVRNGGTAAGDGRVVVSLGNETRVRNVSLPAREGRGLEVEFPVEAVPNRSTANLSVSFADETRSREVQIERAAPPPPTTDPSERPTTATTTANGTEPWPTLVGSRETTDGSPVPGFGPVLAAVAVGLGVTALARRGRSDT